ncbi:hypothetical protein J2Y71_001212 [Bacillus pumilus]|jgi:hypothetical protein|nr:hypothetical protein [Bacillus pumilus]MDF9783970.1 hypothetical protein [Bacillus pumilus]
MRAHVLYGLTIFIMIYSIMQPLGVVIDGRFNFQSFIEAFILSFAWSLLITIFSYFFGGSSHSGYGGGE